MFVRKFEGDSLDETLKSIKRELGPDAIILKTVTNKGLKGAFKKKRIEITAAISEKSYTKKAKVEHIFDEEQKDNFYSANATDMASMINSHSENTDASPSNYGKLGLNRSVSTVNTRELAGPRTSGLDSFLSTQTAVVEEEAFKKRGPSVPEEAVMEREQIVQREQVAQAPSEVQIERPQRSSAPVYREEGDYQELIEQGQKIGELERKIYELSKSLEHMETPGPIGVYHLRTSLRGLDISEKYIQRLIKKALFEFSAEDLEDPDTAFELALRDMLSEIKTEMPLFSTLEDEGEQAITVLLSSASSGQTSMMLKLGALKKGSVLIQHSPSNRNSGFTEKMFGIEMITARTAAEIASECRKAVESGRTVFVDYRIPTNDQDDTKKFVDGLKRAFDKVEVLVSLSAIHSELYNRKVISLCRSLGDGIVISHLDQCLNFGSLFNIAESSKDLPLKFFGTGETVPDDLESATAERILAGIFNFE